ncbi:MAG: hypothetical protein H0X25_02215 [Acidobacteriales bacterium]|nr:hypothetical protein [Terriglobales bacterium]
MKSIVPKALAAAPLSTEDNQRWLTLCRLIFEQRNPAEITEIISGLNAVAGHQTAMRAERLWPEKPKP